MRALRQLVLLVSVLIAFAIAGYGQRIAVITPDDTETSKRFAPLFEGGLRSKATVVDDDLARAAFDAAKFETPYNLTLDQAKRVGQAIGCDFFILLRSNVLRRSSFEREEYYEATFAALLVSTRTGRLAGIATHIWTEATAAEALRLLDRTMPGHASILADRVKVVQKEELSEQPPLRMEEPPDEGSPAAKNFKAPVPFQRIKPQYTSLAEQYDVTATVDIAIDLDENGKVMRTEILRWAGFDLDRAVEKIVRTMNWRPAERDGKFIPMRFVVRYNFKRPDKK